jgi:hypothetical protein
MRRRDTRSSRAVALRRRRSDRFRRGIRVRCIRGRTKRSSSTSVLRRCLGDASAGGCRGRQGDLRHRESGLPTTAEGDAEGDVDRIVWLRAYLAQLQRATDEGVPVRGYFHWSLMDNFEWIFGYQPKFGLFWVETNTLKRTPKLSAHWFREMARRNAVA